jgi:hypothetical protein
MSGYIENWGYGQGDSGGSGNLPTFPDAGAANALAIQTASYVLLIGDVFTITNVVANNTGPTTISINSATPVAIVGLNNTPMQGHELVAGLDAVFFLNSVGTVTLISAMGGALQIADGVQNHHAITIGQLVTQLGLYLKTSNNFSEIAAEGSAAQLAAQTNLAIPPPSNYLQVPNLLDEILALGPTAQATAQSNLGISSGESGPGRLLGTALITSSQTYSMPAGTNTIYAEVCGGGGGSGGLPATSSTQQAVNLPGKAGPWGIVEIPVSQLSTHASNTIIVSIGAGGAAGSGATAGSAGGNTTIDTNLVVISGGLGSSSDSARTATTPYISNEIPPTTNTYIFTATSPSIIISSKNLDGTDYVRISKSVGWITTGIFIFGNAGGSPIFSAFGKNFFSTGDYGCGGTGQLYGISNSGAENGIAGNSGAVRLWFYS